MMKRIADCLPADVQLRIDEYKAQAARGGMRSTPGSYPASLEEEEKAGNVIVMPLRKGTAKQPTGRPAGTVVPFRKSIDRKHG